MEVFNRLDRMPAWSQEEALLFHEVRALSTEKIAPRAENFDRNSEFPWKNIEEINELGLNGIFIPEAYGGAGLSYSLFVACVREIAKACAATGISWATNFHAIKPVIDFGTEEQKRRWLPRMMEGGLASLCITEPTAGSDATGMKTWFMLDGDDIIVNGGKTFITNGDVADLYLVFGKWSEISDSRRSISVLVMEKGVEGLEVVRKEDKMGMRASSTAQLSFDHCRVPRTNLLGQPGEGLKVLFSALNKSRPSVAAHALGIARSALEEGVRYLNERQQSNRRIIEFQGIQFSLADLATDLALCEAWLWRIAGMIDAGENDIGIEASMLKMRASDLAMALTTEAVQWHGGYGYCKDYKVERLMRDAKICQIWEGTNQVHRQLIGRSFIEK